MNKAELQKFIEVIPYDNFTNVYIDATEVVNVDNDYGYGTHKKEIVHTFQYDKGANNE